MAAASRPAPTSPTANSVEAAAVERFGAGDYDEEADHPGCDGADDDVDPLEFPVARLQLLVDAVGLDEVESPGCECGAESGCGDEDRVPLEGQVGYDETSCCLSPVRVGEDPGGDVRDEDR
jgi:hypothetical protein